MQWDQGLLTVVLATGFTFIGVAACGPSRYEVPMLNRPRAVKALDQCAIKIGRHAKTIGGDKQKVEIPVCQMAVDRPTSVNALVAPAKNEYRPLLTEVGYQLRADEKRHLVVSLSVGLEMSDSKNAASTEAAVKAISAMCLPKITKLWNDSRVGAELNLTFTPVTSVNADSQHVLFIDGNPDDARGLSMAHWADKAKFFQGARAADTALCLETVPTSAREERLKCSRRAQQMAHAESDRFCVNLAVMTAHYLGLAADDAKEGRCDATKAPSGKPNSFMDAASLYSTSEFWNKVRFTDLDRRTIMAPGCSDPIAMLTRGSPLAKN